MVKRHHKAEDGMYHIGNQKYELLKGSRVKWHGITMKQPVDLKSRFIKKQTWSYSFTPKHTTAKRENAYKNTDTPPKR